MEIEKDTWNSKEQLAIMDRYDRVIAYLYPIAQSIPRKHGVARDLFLRALLGQAELFYAAGKSNQVSAIYRADAGLAGWADSHNLTTWMENRYGISDYQFA